MQAGEPHLPFIEDATSLQFVLNRVLRCINSGPANHKTWALMLYALQIACTNLKSFMTEHPRAEAAEGERAAAGNRQPQTAEGSERQGQRRAESGGVPAGHAGQGAERRSRGAAASYTQGRGLLCGRD
jgi:hypothetical protein